MFDSYALCRLLKLQYNIDTDKQTIQLHHHSYLSYFLMEIRYLIFFIYLYIDLIKPKLSSNVCFPTKANK